MAFDRGFLDELSARCDIVDVISRYVQLKKSGANYMGLCPFHNEKTASFSVAPDKQMYHCFGCGAGGGVIHFIMQAEGLEFPDAVRFVAQQVGMPVPEDTQNPQAAYRRERVLQLCKDAARFFYDTLWTAEHAPVQQYFAKRGLSRPVMNRFGLGYAPNTFSALIDVMQAKGYRKEEMLDAGLISRSENGHMYDRFRNRVMFPIIDTRGQVIAFGGRVMDDSKPKYLNSPETTLFHKSRNLFALNLAKKSKAEYFILAEGYMDVIALHQAGFDSAVASLGTSLTEEQARLLARYTKKVVISYDADSAGQAAAQRAIDILKRADLTVHVLRIPDAKDPDEYIRSHGADAYRRLIEGSENDNIYRLDAIASKYALDEDEARVAFLREAAQSLAKIENSVEREVYIRRAASMAHIGFEAMQIEVKRQLALLQKKKKTAQRREIRAPATAAQPKDKTLQYADVRSARAEEGILQMIFTDDSLLNYLDGKLTADAFTAPVLRKIYQYACQLHAQGSLVTFAAYEGYLQSNELAHLSSVLCEPVSLHRREQALDDYIDIIQKQQSINQTTQPTKAGEDPLEALARMKREKNSVGGHKV